jgi:hypothetical protein
MEPDLYLEVLKEFDVHLSDAQKAQFEQVFRDLAVVEEKLDEDTATSVDHRLKELRSTQLTSEKMKALLTPDQRTKLDAMFAQREAERRKNDPNGRR